VHVKLTGFQLKDHATLACPDLWSGRSAVNTPQVCLRCRIDQNTGSRVAWHPSRWRYDGRGLMGPMGGFLDPPALPIRDYWVLHVAEVGMLLA